MKPYPSSTGRSVSSITVFMVTACVTWPACSTRLRGMRSARGLECQLRPLGPSGALLAQIGQELLADAKGPRVGFSGGCGIHFAG